MSRIFSMAVKDLKILLRDRTSAFFIVGFPILMGLFFGSIMGGGGGGGSSAMKIAIVDLDQTESSAKFVSLLKENANLELLTSDIESSKTMVRKGSAAGLIAISPGFAEKAEVFWGEPPEIQMGVDPSRNAEAAMLRGYVMEALGAMIGEGFGNPDKFRKVVKRERDRVTSSGDLNLVERGLYMGLLDSVDSMMDSVDDLQNQENATETQQQDNSAGGFQFANIQDIDVTREIDPKSRAGQLQKIRSSWDISFPQAMLWGILGCVAGFSASIARENTVGTMTRLQAAPMPRFAILAGKALACFITVVFVIAMMTLLGYFLGMRPGNYAFLVIASLAVAMCFVGIMMSLSVVGKTEQSVSGIGWMANMVMAMFGGCMIPVMFMPNWIRSVSVLSPVRWAITAIEGAIWRDFSFNEMLLPCGILILFGLGGLVIGTTILSKRLK
jgi:ABC-2 type transport system permease protein